MRPLKLAMTAFGPYKHKEVIDFTELKDNRLFVVSGNTGAGKTTIFDAICFALYGSASGEDRNDGKYMRSDFAEDDVNTSVELEFELHDHHYRIKRQLSHVKKGNKSATGEQYEFYEKQDDREKPCVDRQIVSEINKKIESLIGLTKDQFSQIVMLPQGEFRKLLTSQTENKEEILRKIFKTEPFQWISERLKEKKKEAETEFNREKETRNRFISEIQSAIPSRVKSVLFDVLSQQHFNMNQVMIGLDEETDFFKNEIEINKKQAETAEIKYNQKLEEFHKADALNNEFLKLEDKEKRFDELTDQAPIFTEKETLLENAERAGMIESYEQQVNEWRTDEIGKQQNLTAAESNQKNAALQLEIAQKYYHNEEMKKEIREELARKLDRYNGFLPTVKEIERKKAELLTLQKDLNKTAEELDGLQNRIKNEKSTKDKISDDIKRMDQKVEQLGDKQLQLKEMRDQVRVLQEYLSLEKKQIELEQTLKINEKGYQEIKKQFEALENAWVNGQASILAAHLHDGKPCPVCGSIEHPNKAQRQDAVPTKEELESAKNGLNEMEKDYRNTVARCGSNREQLDLKAAAAMEIGITVSDVQAAYDRLVKAGKEMKQEVDSLLKERETLQILKKDHENKEQVLAQLESEEKNKAAAYQEQKTSFETTKAVYVEQVNRIPEDIRILNVLEEKIAETTKEKGKLEKAWEIVQRQLQSAAIADTKAASDLSHARKQLEDSTNNKIRLEKQFTKLLEAAEFTSEEAYRQAKRSEKERKQLKEEINQFKNELAAVKQRISELQVSLKDKTKPDIPALQTESEQLKKIADDAGDVLRQSTQNLQKVIDLRKKIYHAEQKVTELEKQLSVITDLYDIVRGQNSSKISFERYLQIEFLEQIIIAANERLRHLSNGQFLLIRSDRQESRGKQSGLGLDVYDSYTGQNRDVKTLSGGEKFNASLCLALGMADVIQSYQGGVSIDTMFIDEGFGSLDEESLNKAIDTLIDLQKSGRMIGVISHVQELKNAIPAILEVTKTKEGFSQTKFVLK